MTVINRSKSEPAVAQANIFIGRCVQDTAAVLIALFAVERLGCHVTYFSLSECGSVLRFEN